LRLRCGCVYFLNLLKTSTVYCSKCLCLLTELILSFYLDNFIFCRMCRKRQIKL